MAGYFADINQTAPGFLRPRRRVASFGAGAGIDTPEVTEGERIAQAAIEAQQPLIDASIDQTQANTDFIRAKTGQLGRRYQHPLRRGISGSTPAAGQSPGLGAPISAAVNPQRDLAAETRGNPEFQARVAAETAQRTAAQQSRLAAVRNSILQRRAASPAPTVTEIPNAVKGGVEGSARTIAGQYGKGFSFTPRPIRRVTPRTVTQQASPVRKNPLFAGR